MHYLSHELRGDERPDLVDVFRHLSQVFDGAYNIVFMNAMGDMAILRDPKGFRPMCYARMATCLRPPARACAFESRLSRYSLAGAGEMILIQDGEIRRERFAEPQTHSHCFFEVDLLCQRRQHIGRAQCLPGPRRARPGIGAREERRLARVPIDNDTIVVPVPDTGKGCRRCHGL